VTLPRWVRSFVAVVVPAEFSDDLLDDLEEGWRRRRDAGRRAYSWLLAELARTPWLGLRRQARRLRRHGARAAKQAPRVRGGGSIGTGLRIAARSLLKRPGYASVAILTLATSIGAATLVFSVLEGVLLRPLPYPDGDRLHRIFGTNEAWREAEQEVLRDSWNRLSLAEEIIDRFRGSIAGIVAVGGYAPTSVRMDDAGDPVELSGAWVLEGFFDVLDMAPLVGRLPDRIELAAGARVVVIGERLWASRWGRDPDVLGRSVTLDEEAYTIVGVMPADFAVPNEVVRWWAPLPDDFADGRLDLAIFHPLVRLGEPASREATGRELDEAIAAVARDNPSYAGMGARLQPLAELLVAEVRDGIKLLFWAVLVVALIASVNLANLVIARGARRRGELAMRAALGASRNQLVWSMLAETSVICLVGAGLGVVIATQLLEPFLALLARATPGFPRADNVELNATVLAFSIGVTVLTATLSGLLPALAASRRSPWEALQHGKRSGGGRGTRRTQRTLLVVEAALAMVLLALAGLLTRGALHVAAIDPGYETERVAYLRLRTSPERYSSGAEAEALGATLEERIARLPGIQATARTSSLPGLGGADGKLLWRLGARMEDAPLTWAAYVSPGYFEAMDIPVLIGRTFTEADGPDDAPVVVVSELFAERNFPGEDPLGQTILMGSGERMQGGDVVADGEEEMTVVGVVGDVRQLVVFMEPDPGVYRPIAQTSGNDPILVLRTTERAAEVLPAARDEVRAVDSDLLVLEADVLRTSMRRLLGGLELRLVLIVALAGLAVFLTVVGIYGVVAYVVSEQLHEIGLRMALGARSGGEAKRMLLHALKPVLAGGLLGLGGGYAASGLVESGLFGVSALDPLTYVFGLLALSVVTVLAAWLPARRAATVDPMRVLNDD
jgi:putative ABC transport system permease protein